MNYRLWSASPHMFAYNEEKQIFSKVLRMLNPLCYAFYVKTSMLTLKHFDI